MQAERIMVPGDELNPSDVLLLRDLARGMRQDEIAAKFGTEPANIRSRAYRLREKMGARTTAHAIYLFLRQHPSDA